MNKKSIAFTVIIVTLVLFVFDIQTHHSPNAETNPIFTSSNSSIPIVSGESSQTANTEMSNDEARQYLRVFLSNVAGLDINAMTNFRVSNTEYSSQKNQTTIFAVIDTKTGRGSVELQVANGKVISFIGPNVAPTKKQVSLNDCQVIAKAAISNYTTGFNATYCEGFSNSTPNILLSQNSTIENENVILNIRSITDENHQLESASFCWYRKIFNLKVPALRVEATINRQGMLTSFVDKMAIYKVATTNVTITKAQAIKIAMPNIEKYAATHNLRIQATVTSFGYATEQNSTRGDNTILYPIWNVEVGFYHINSYITGYSVLLWADNGLVFSSGPQGVLAHQTLLISRSSQIDNQK